MAVENPLQEPTSESPYYARHDPTQSEPLSTTLCETLATIEGVPPAHLDLCLYDHIDTEAVDDLFRAANPDGHWQFSLSIKKYAVTIHGDGEIVVAQNEE